MDVDGNGDERSAVSVVWGFCGFDVWLSVGGDKELEGKRWESWESEEGDDCEQGWREVGSVVGKNGSQLCRVPFN
jgi:hypothetical protein